MRATKSERLDMLAVREAVRAVVESKRYADWLMEMPDEVLVQVAAPLEMLQFQFYVTPPLDRHLVRAARVCCQASAPGIATCPPDMADALLRLAAVVGVTT